MPECSRHSRNSPVVRSSPEALTAMLFVLLMANPTGLGAVTFTVTRTDDQLDSAPGDGVCIALNGGGCSLRAAVQEANALSGADGIYLPAGTYSLSIAGAGEDLAASGDLDITSGITLLGTGWGVTTIAMESYADRLFDIQGFSGLELGDVTLAGGSVAGVGGGVYVRTGGSFAIRRSRIQGCLARHGGAIGTSGGSVTIEDAELSGNWALSDPPTWYARGPAVAADEQATVIVRRSSLHGNRSDSGSLRNVAVWNSSLTVESSSLVNDTFSSGGIEATLSDVVVLSSTVDRISVDGSSLPGASLILGCSIVGYCNPSGGSVTYTNYGLNVFFDGMSCVGPSDVDGEWNLYPLWAPPGRFPARVPNPWSSALERGHPFICLAVDQWSQTQRPFDNDGNGIPVLEIGAVEAATLIFLDGFEIGSTAFWSNTIP